VFFPEEIIFTSALDRNMSGEKEEEGERISWIDGY